MNILDFIRGVKVTYVKKDHVGQNAYTFYFNNPGIEYKAGQHFVFRLPHKNADRRGSVRIFSMSSKPAGEFITFTTRYFGDKSSSYKKALMKMEMGDTIEVRGPSPIYDVYKITDPATPHVFIAGGIGITPFKSVLEDISENYPNTRGALFYINKDDDFIFGSDIKKLTSKLTKFTFLKKISPKRLTIDEIQAVINNFDKEPIYKVSGTIGFVDYYTKLLLKSGVPKRFIKAYRYRGLLGDY